MTIKWIQKEEPRKEISINILTFPKKRWFSKKNNLHFSIIFNLITAITKKVLSYHARRQ